MHRQSQHTTHTLQSCLYPGQSSNDVAGSVCPRGTQLQREGDAEGFHEKWLTMLYFPRILCFLPEGIVQRRLARVESGGINQYK